MLKPNRRTFIAAGAVGAGALAIAGWWKDAPPANPPGIVPPLGADGEDILRAVVPVMLSGALPAELSARAMAIDATMAALADAIGGLPAAAQAELAQLFALLSLPPVRLAVARLDAPWAQAEPAQVRACLDRFRDSPLILLRAAYDGLHQLIFAAWYGNPRAWSAIGYPGPPALA
ncbi:MAG: twin-arginine translocation signal domain-containing protein [Casimicrobiaceae bacterium]